MKIRLLALAALLSVALGMLTSTQANAKAIVKVAKPGIALTFANAVAPGAIVPTPADLDLLFPPFFLGSGTCVPNGAFVESKDLEANFGFTNVGAARGAYNKCADGLPDNILVMTFIKGIAAAGRPSRDGNSVSAIGDTAVSDSFQVRISPVNATTANLIVNGEALIQRTIPAPGIGRLDVLVYPDSTVANLDPTRSGVGAIFRGLLIVDRDGIEKAEGNWSASDFQVQLTTDRARVRAVNLTKVIAAPNTAVLAAYVSADASAVAVPASTPVVVSILSLLMAGAGWMAIRRSQARA